MKTGHPNTKVIIYVTALIIALLFLFWAINSNRQSSQTPINSSEQNNPVSNNDTSWMSGGTLHKATMREWEQATYANRLATAADFIAATQNVDYGNLGQFKQMATQLEACISKAGEGGSADNEQVVVISSYCLTLLFPK